MLLTVWGFLCFTIWLQTVEVCWGIHSKINDGKHLKSLMPNQMLMKGRMILFSQWFSGSEFVVSLDCGYVGISTDFQYL